MMAENSHLISKMPERETGLPNTYWWVAAPRPILPVPAVLLALCRLVVNYVCRDRADLLWQYADCARLVDESGKKGWPKLDDPQRWPGSPGVDLAGRGWGPTVVTSANAATSFLGYRVAAGPCRSQSRLGWQNGGKIDKAFRIATPMRKASWTKRFAEGWGERRGANGDGGSGGEGWREWAGGVSEKSLPSAQR